VAGNAHEAYGPGSAGYVAQLKAYDDAFGAFFDRLAADGINKSNTMFVFTVDEGDHFVGGTPTPANCDGVTTPCDWTGQVGEINANIDTLIADQFPTLATQFLGASAPNAFTVHGDDAPTFYLAAKGAGQLAQDDPANRDFERQIANLTAINPYTSATDHLMVAMADQAEMKLLHMYTAGDPNRDPNFTFFGDPNYFLTDFPSSTCETCINPAFAWNHGDIQPEIATTWLGFVGPGIRPLGEDGSIWTDHTDVRPTMLSVLGLTDTYTHDGRAILEILKGSAVAHAANVHRGSLQALGAAYKQLDAPFGALSMASLKVSTAGIQTGSSSDDSAYTAMDARIVDWTAQRDALAGQIAAVLDGAEFGGHAASEATIKHLTKAADTLIQEVQAAAG
jgi:arylsulfatase A-like enzyme